ncbi:neutral zinc metallopeptidase [Streptomyces sp. NPDC051940]|uniref:KPN_02809 family neutral zinc metallopeptidase n=1 Tax=Streptomyces sp. NPDC051940 TaxID=3155675 RepID=UPI003428CE99
MQFDDKADLDTSQVQDVRGRGRLGTPAVKAGGLIGLIVALVGLFFGVGTDRLGLTDEGEPEPATTTAADLARQCRTGADANASTDCRVVGVVNSVQSFWSQEFRRRGGTYRDADTVVYSGGVRTACGSASSAVGPFYCPGDNQVYLDLTFFDELQSRFGASGGPFAQAYVIAHEYGHHVQYLTGVMDRIGPDSGQGTASNSVRLELQADCYAGVWAHHAQSTPQPGTGRPLITSITAEDVRDGLDAAAAVGDDRIQERFTGRITPETWTHGSAAQRQQWFARGLREGDMGMCDTFR